MRVFQVSPGVFEDTLSTLGTIHAAKEIKLAFEKSGTIRAMQFEEGQAVPSGYLLAHLDAREDQLGLLHSQAKLQVEETSLERTRKKFENHQNLLEAGSILQSRLDEVELEVKEAQQRVEAAKIQVDYSKAALAKTHLIAPSAGTIAVKNSEAGETVTPNTLVATLVDLTQVVCEVDITEQEYYRVRVGAPCILHTDALMAYFFKGNVASIPPVLTGKSRSIRIRIKVNDAGNLLLPGMIVHVKILLYKKEGALTVPSDAIHFVQGKPFVFVVDAATKNAQLRAVTLAYQGQETVEISEGLQSSDQVILGQSFSQDQVPVEVVETQIPAFAAAAGK